MLKPVITGLLVRKNRAKLRRTHHCFSISERMLKTVITGLLVEKTVQNYVELITAFQYIEKQ